MHFVAAFFQEAVNSVGGVEQFADGHIVIERIDNIGDVFGHLHFRIPLPLPQFGGAIDQIGGKYPVEKPAFFLIFGISSA